MAGIDGLLRMAIGNQADELHVGTDVVPRMLARGAAIRLSMPATDGETVKHLLAGLLTAEHEATLASGGKVELTHALDGGPTFAVTCQGRPGSKGLDVVFRRAAPAARTAAPPGPAPASPPAIAAPAPSAVAAPAPAAVPSGPIELRSLEVLLTRAVAMHASDLHLCAGEPASVRIDGRLRPLGEASVILGERALAELSHAVPADADASRSVDRGLALPGIGKLRVNLYRSLGRAAAAIRLLPPAAPVLQALDLPPALEELIDAPHGLVLVCGPTGAGKSATLAALAQAALGRRGGLLITLEDPVEYAISAAPSSLVRQREIGADVPDFATGLRDALREDPDVLLIGEMRDAESIGLALTAAETGHLVLASLHSRSSASTIERIVDTYPPERQQQIRRQLADALRAVVCQRLLPRARGGGRVPAVEILRGTHNVASLIREGKTEQLSSAVQAGRKEGMLPLERHLAELVRNGTLDRPTAAAAANDATALQSYLQG